MANNFQFVTLTHPGEVKSKQNQSLIRAHAIRGAMRSAGREAVKRRKTFVTPRFQLEPSLQKLDPFDTLPNCPERLRVLMRHKKARQAGEPIFCVGDSGTTFFQSLDTVLKGALADRALFHALSLSLALVVNDGKANVECLMHRGKALREIAEKLSSSKNGQAIYASTLCAMLLLIGYEYRVEGGDTSSVGVHLQAVHQVIRQCNQANVFFCDTIRRAIFWQDLTSCLLVGTTRQLSHEKFPELSWQRDTYRESFYVLPQGFDQVRVYLPESLIEVLEDVNALCTLLDASCLCGDLPISQVQIDNAQAWIESRLANLLVELRFSKQHESIYEACLYITYACTYKLSTSIWEGSLVPNFCASQVLRIMQEAENDGEWGVFPELLLWLLFVGGSLAEKRDIRLQFIALILGSYRERIADMHSTWLGAKCVLRRFIWSSSMAVFARDFWSDVHPS